MSNLNLSALFALISQETVHVTTNIYKTSNKFTKPLRGCSSQMVNLMIMMDCLKLIIIHNAFRFIL